MSVSALSLQASRAASHAAELAAASGQAGRLSALPKDQQIKAVAGQFEAIMLRQFLQESVNGMMGGDSGGAAGSVYGYLVTDVLADKMSAGGGLGLSRILQQQLSPHRAAHAAPKASP